MIYSYAALFDKLGQMLKIITTSYFSCNYNEYYKLFY